MFFREVSMGSFAARFIIGEPFYQGSRFESRVFFSGGGGLHFPSSIKQFFSSFSSVSGLLLKRRF